MINYIYTKETLTDEGKKVLGYTRLTMLLESEPTLFERDKMGGIYRTVRRHLISGKSFIIKNIIIRKVPLIHQKNAKRIKRHH